MGEPGGSKKTLQLRKKIRRGWGGKKNRKNINFSILACNANGLWGKFESLKNNINYFKPSCVMIQESKLRNLGSLKLQGYQIFELNRQGMGGGLFTAIDEKLSPVLLRSGPENAEILVTQIRLAGLDIRLVNGYGPQEAASKDDILNFWHALEMEIIDARDAGCGIMIELDANAKLGSSVISGDPHGMSSNGQILFNLAERHNLTIANASDKCTGTITRHRSTIENEEKAVLDYVVFCNIIEPFFNSMLIDEKRYHVLKKYVTRKGLKSYVESDHNSLYTKFDLKYIEKASVTKREIFNFKNKEAQEHFSSLTSNTRKFSLCFDQEKSFEVFQNLR